MSEFDNKLSNIYVKYIHTLDRSREFAADLDIRYRIRGYLSDKDVSDLIVTYSNLPKWFPPENVSEVSVLLEPVIDEIINLYKTLGWNELDN